MIWDVKETHTLCEKSREPVCKAPEDLPHVRYIRTIHSVIVSPWSWQKVVWLSDVAWCGKALKEYVNPLRPNSDLIQTSHCNIKGLSVREVMRVENMITQVKFYWYFNSFSPLLLWEMYGDKKGEFAAQNPATRPTSLPLSTTLTLITWEPRAHLLPVPCWWQLTRRKQPTKADGCFSSIFDLSGRHRSKVLFLEPLSP